MMKQFETQLIGNSMSPTIKNGERLKCEFQDPSTFEVGDIVFFLDPSSNEYTIHRLISLSPPLTKGDRAYSSESPKEILGKVVLKENFVALKVLLSRIMLMKKPIRYIGYLGFKIIP